METVSGRYDDFTPVGNALLCMPDFDEALFPLRGLLNFTVNITGDKNRPTIEVETQMLTDEDAHNQVEQAPRSISGVKEMNLILHCQHAPNEPGSLRKRVIVLSH